MDQVPENETKVNGKTVQKADVVFRSRITQSLVLIEAKAVGVEIDAIKRVKECSDKASDWRNASDLEEPVIVAVIADFFSESSLRNLSASRISVVWEHRLSELGSL